MRRLELISAIALIAGGAALSGCEQRTSAPGTAPDVSAQGTPQEQPGQASPADAPAASAQTWVDDVTLGTEVAADGTIPTDKQGDDFAPGQPVSLAMKVADAPANTSVKVIWFGPNDTKFGEDVKHVEAGQQYMSFTAPTAPAQTKGDYRAEVWVGDEKVDEQHFNVTDASKAAEAGGRPDRG